MSDGCSCPAGDGTAAGAWLPFWEAAPADTLCYCFGHTESSIRAQQEATGGSTAESSIRARIAVGECACEQLNPEGRCCLGAVGKFVKSLKNG